MGSAEIYKFPSSDDLLARAWAWLAEVPDPEIPAVSVVDLGIVRDVIWDDDNLIVEITPTYSGCPATAVIALDIETALLKKGLENVTVKSKLSPPWTTAWITPEGRDKLKAYGIAPPVEDVSSCAGLLKFQGTQQANVSCPRCSSNQTERVSQFGSTPCKASYRCKSCLEPFDYFKSF